jgi:hypothetical protein
MLKVAPSLAPFHTLFPSLARYELLAKVMLVEPDPPSTLKDTFPAIALVVGAVVPPGVKQFKVTLPLPPVALCGVLKEPAHVALSNCS